MRVFILGHRGMLGHVVARYLRENGFDVCTTDLRFTRESANELRELVRRSNSEWCINCIGIGPGRGASPEQMRTANVEIPRACARLGLSLMHASTDGVFAPDRPERRCAEPPDATDEYGLQKREGEAIMSEAGAVIIRCSIIGPEAQPTRNLLQWALTQTKPISGFINQLWNGITTLEWAVLASRVLAEGLRPNSDEPVIQPGYVPPISKFELLKYIVDEWGTGTPVGPASSKQPVNRWLAPTLAVAPIKKQLNALHQWY